jgi:hypothetical protein
VNIIVPVEPVVELYDTHVRPSVRLPVVESHNILCISGKKPHRIFLKQLLMSDLHQAFQPFTVSSLSLQGSRYLRVLRKIIFEEANNAIFINVSSGSKIQSIASMMACMIFKDRVDITPYYAVPEKYTTIPREQETVGVKKILKLPEYKIQTPPDNLIKCLEIIYKWKNYRISNKDLRDQALEKNLIHVERHEHREQSAYMALKTNLLEPLLKWQYIRVEKIGRRHDIILTPEGLNVLKFLYTEETLDQ